MLYTAYCQACVIKFLEDYLYFKTLPQIILLVSFGELLVSQVVQQEAIIILLLKKRVFPKEEFLEMESISRD